jgi:hypothetical protein
LVTSRIFGYSTFVLWRKQTTAITFLFTANLTEIRRGNIFERQAGSVDVLRTDDPGPPAQLILSATNRGLIAINLTQAPTN